MVITILGASLNELEIKLTAQITGTAPASGVDSLLSLLIFL